MGTLHALEPSSARAAPRQPPPLPVFPFWQLVVCSLFPLRTMPLQPSRRIKLLWLILGLTIASALVSLGITLVSSYHVQRQHLIDTTLDHHQAYATKVAASIDDFTLALQQQLAYSAQQVAAHMGNNTLLEQEVRRLQH